MFLSLQLFAQQLHFLLKLCLSNSPQNHKVDELWVWGRTPALPTKSPYSALGTSNCSHREQVLEKACPWHRPWGNTANWNRPYWAKWAKKVLWGYNITSRLHLGNSRFIPPFLQMVVCNWLGAMQCCNRSAPSLIQQALLMLCSYHSPLFSVILPETLWGRLDWKRLA